MEKPAPDKNLYTVFQSKAAHCTIYTMQRRTKLVYMKGRERQTIRVMQDLTFIKARKACSYRATFVIGTVFKNSVCMCSFMR